MSFEAEIESADPGPEEQRAAEMVRRELDGDFWVWLRKRIQLESQADILALADPKTPSDMVQFLRGKIRARNEDLLLPIEFVRRYDFERGMEAGESTVQDTPGAPRRLSAIMEDGDGGQPDQPGGGHPELWSD